MSIDTNSSNGNGVGFMGILTILFIGLKLAGYVVWPWAWVVSPIWIPIGIGGFLLFVMGSLVSLGDKDKGYPLLIIGGIMLIIFGFVIGIMKWFGLFV